MVGGTVSAASPQSPASRATATLDVTVLMGGPSSEREVSLVSGKAVSDALERRGHRVTRSDIGPDDTAALERKGIDVVFIALHGQFGESGEVQRLCQLRRLPYTGSGPRASAAAMDKVATKEICRRAGLLTPDWVVLDRASDRRAQLEALGLPVVLKPLDGGSSVDVYICRSADSRDQAAAKLLGKYHSAMAEQFVAGREMTVGVLDGQALPSLEICAAREFYDYTAKYADGAGTRYSFDHGLSAQADAAMRQAALDAYNAVGCRDMGRIDFIVDAQNRCHLLEINTIPGFTGHSLLPMAAGRAGISFEALVDRLVRLAMARGAD